MLIAARYLCLVSVCMHAIIKSFAQIVQLVRRAKVAQAALDVQTARLANTKKVLLKQTV